MEVVRVLRGAGHIAYFAGGCVRDALRGHAPQDYDIATDAQPPRVRELFKHSRFVGEAFGVVLVNMLGDHASDSSPSQGEVGRGLDAQLGEESTARGVRTSYPPPAPPWEGGESMHSHREPDHPTARGRFKHQVEVATFRTEWGYEDGRRPSGVAFCDAETDARRRDFTVNGLFEDPLAASPEARIIDYVGGRDDLARRVIRAIGDPHERFGEDYLRMLRAVRFAARMDFRLDLATAAAIRAHAPQLNRISRERIGQEIEAMLTGPRPLRCVRLLQRLGLDGPVLEEVSRHRQDDRTPTVALAARLGRKSAGDIVGVLAAWMLDRHLPPAPLQAEAGAAFRRGWMRNAVTEFAAEPAAAVIPRWRNALCLNNDQRDALRDVISHLPVLLNWEELPVAQRKRLLARRIWPTLWLVARAINWQHGMPALLVRIERESTSLFVEGVAPPRLLTGDALIALGFKPGPKFGALLEAIYDAQLEKTITTRDEAVAWAKAREG